MLTREEDSCNSLEIHILSGTKLLLSNSVEVKSRLFKPLKIIYKGGERNGF